MAAAVGSTGSTGSTGSAAPATIEVASDAFDCPICAWPMIKHIYLCTAGHSICEDCYNKLTSWNCPQCNTLYPAQECRNRTLEALASTIDFECQWGCGRQAKPEQLRKHIEEECLKAMKKCPVWGCDHENDAENLPTHIQVKHVISSKEVVQWWRGDQLAIGADQMNYVRLGWFNEMMVLVTGTDHPLFLLVQLGWQKGGPLLTIQVHHFLKPMKFSITLSGRDPATHSLTFKGVTAPLGKQLKTPQVTLCSDAGSWLWNTEAAVDRQPLNVLGVQVSTRA